MTSLRQSGSQIGLDLVGRTRDDQNQDDLQERKATVPGFAGCHRMTGLRGKPATTPIASNVNGSLKEIEAQRSEGKELLYPETLAVSGERLGG